MQIDDGVLVPPLPEDYENQRDRGDHGKDQDKVRCEPIIALTLVENNLQSSQAQGYETQANIVDGSFSELAALEVRRS